MPWQSIPAMIRFEKFTTTCTETSCVFWLGTRCGGQDGRSYGQFGTGGKNNHQTAHRWIYEHHHGPIAKGLQVRHLCGQSLCVNVEHLSVGTPSENEADKTTHGTKIFGERMFNARLTEDLVREIRQSALPLSYWVAALGVSQTAIAQARTGKTWKHLS